MQELVLVLPKHAQGYEWEKGLAYHGSTVLHLSFIVLL